MAFENGSIQEFLYRIANALTGNVIAGQAAGVGVTDPALATTNALLALLTNAVNYETVAASATAQVMGGAGAIGDYISHIIIQPGSVSPGR